MSEYPCGGLRREQDLMLYVGGELLPWEKRRVEAHLRECPHCQKQQRLLRTTMQSVAAEVRGSGMPHWAPQEMVSATAVSTPFYHKPVNSSRLATLVAISAAVAALTSYMAATYGDHLMSSHFVPLSHVNIEPTPPCESSPTAKADKSGKSCHNCASPAPKAVGL